MGENSALGRMVSEITTEAAMAWLFRKAAGAPINIAPERQDEFLRDVFGQGPWPLRPSNEPATFAAVPEESAVYASWAGQASLWCLSYASFQIMDIATRVARSTRLQDRSIVDFGAVFGALNIKEYIAYTNSLFQVDKPWPPRLNKPIHDPAEGSEEWLVNNIYLGALAWILLHEIGHVHHGDQKFVPTELRMRQEYQADAFATKWILDEAGRGMQREYRTVAIVIGLAWLFLNETALGPSNTHPAAILRFREAIEHFDVGDRSVALECAAYVLKVLFDPESEPPVFDDSRKAFDWVVGRLDQKFGWRSV